MKSFLHAAAMFLLACAPAMAQDCYSGRQQRYEYERGVAPAAASMQITACLQKQLDPANFEAFDAASAMLRKSGNAAGAMPAMLQILKTSTDPRIAFTASAFLISSPEELAQYEGDLMTLVTSPAQPDYKKTLAVVALAATESLGPGYAPFLEPAINGEDKFLQAYAAAAYTIIVPGAGAQYLDKIIFLYGFDKSFAQMAFIASGAKDSALHAAIKAAIKSDDWVLRLSAIEWAGDAGDSKLLAAVLDGGYRQDDAAALAAAAQAMVPNFGAMRGELKKAFKKSPKNAQATIAVMAYTFAGAQYYDDIELFLQSGNKNEVANALRVVAGAAEILVSDSAYYPNAALEEFKIKSFVPLAARIDDGASAAIKPYSQSAVRELYKLLNR